MASDEQRFVVVAREWLSGFQERVRAVDFAGARPFFAEDVVAFGTWAAVVRGQRRLENEQWSNVWPRIRGFTFRLGDLAVLGGPEGLCVVVPWDSRGVRSDGSEYERPGRATLFLIPSAGRWLAAHSHFSLVPERGG
ncbi:MAG TPA: nuclear transport factor 2 family protein [Chloroflexota bacterium]|nr:nuclear transport factor 2 family protein [Chloroflexota bacterium]